MAVIFKSIFLNENCCILIQILFVTKSPFNDNLSLVQMMARRPIGDEPVSEPMVNYITDAYIRHSASMS